MTFNELLAAMWTVSVSEPSTIWFTEHDRTANNLDSHGGFGTKADVEWSIQAHWQLASQMEIAASILEYNMSALKSSYSFEIQSYRTFSP
jgi:hypothetical protein